MTSLADDTRWLDATDQAALVARGQATALELLDAAIERIERLDPAINAVNIRWFDHARDIARGTLPDGPFRGVPFLLKGGHAPGEELTDCLAWPTGEAKVFVARRAPNVDTHGSGCTLGAAITAQRALGRPLAQAVQGAKTYVEGGLRKSLAIGEVTKNFLQTIRNRQTFGYALAAGSGASRGFNIHIAKDMLLR